jgi:cell division protein FtsN
VSGPALEPLPEGTAYLQVGAFTSATSAARLSTNLRKQGLQPEIHSGLVDGQGYYRVRFGPYELPRDRSILEMKRAELRKAGFEPIVMRPEQSE